MVKTARLISLLFVCCVSTSPAQNWPAWRGPTGDNKAAQEARPPISWSEDTNVKWKVPIHGIGASTPVVWGDRIYFTSSVETEREGKPAPQPKDVRGPAPTRYHEFWVLAHDRRTGKLVWKTKVTEAIPHERGHRVGTYASGSPMTDGERIYAFYGTRGLYCLDLAGKVLWSKKLGTMHTLAGFGEGATPVLAGGVVVVTWDHEGPSFVVAFDKVTGKERWRRERATDSSWGSPAVTTVNGRTQVIVTGSKVTRAYDLESGEPVWSCGGMSMNPVNSALVANGVAYVMNSYKGKIVQAIRLAGAAGDVTGSKNVLWTYATQAPYVPLPVEHEGLLYFLRDSKGVLSCLEAATGKPVYSGERLGVRTIYASPIVAGGRIYFSSRGGKTVVVKPGRKFEILETNSLDDAFDATPIALGKQLILRGRRNLYCIGE